MLRLSDSSPSLQLAWKKSSYFTFKIIYRNNLLNFLHTSPCIIVGNTFIFQNLIQIDWLRTFIMRNLSLELEDELIVDLTYLTALHESPSPWNSHFKCWLLLVPIRSPMSFSKYALLMSPRHSLSPQDMLLSKGLVLDFHLQFREVFVISSKLEFLNYSIYFVWLQPEPNSCVNL